MSVQSSQPSIERGQAAGYVVEVSTVGGSASNVSVTLTAQPSSQKPEFTSGCATGDGTASCAVSSVTAEEPVSLHAQIAVASSATSVSSVKLTATASVATTVTWTPPAASETVAVTPASTSKKPSTTAASPPASSAGTSVAAANLPAVTIGPVPDLNGESSKLVGSGNAASLFPAITRSAAPPAAAANRPQAARPSPDPLSNSTALPVGAPGLTAQAAVLIAVGLAIILTVTRLSLRKRSRGPDS